MLDLSKLATEQRNPNTLDLDEMSPLDIVSTMNKEDENVVNAVKEVVPEVAKAIELATDSLKRGGRLIYIGAGTSGRLGIVDASEIPPTYGVYDAFIGLIAGGDKAIRTAVENAEDDPDGAWKDMEPFHPTVDDVVIGIAASGTTPYVIGGLRHARENGLLTGCITCNSDAPVTAEADIPIAVVVGPEFVTGSTRMKAGTAQKLILNMISTSCMIRLGHVHGNKMVDMQLSNAKLVDRGTRMIMDETGITDYQTAKSMLLKYGQVRAAVTAYFNSQKHEA